MKKSRAGLLVIALFIASLNLRPAINSISPLIETLRNDLGMSASIASLLTSIPVFCMGMFSPMAAKLAGRFGIERVIGGALVLIGLGTVLRLFTTSSSFLLLTAFLAGLGIASIGPLLSGFIKRYFPNQVPLMISVYTVALTIGAALASGLSAPLQSGLDSWKASLSVWAMLALVAVPVWWFFVQRRVEQPSKTDLSQPSIALPWGNPKAWLLTISFGLMAMIFYTVTAWLPPIIQDMGYSKIYAGNSLTLFAAIQIPTSLLLPLLLKRYPSRLFWLLISSLIELSGFLMLIFSLPPWMAALLIGIGASGLFSINLILPIDVTNTPQQAASWSAMTQSIGYVIGASGPLLLGSIHDFTGSFTTSIFGLIGICLLMMVVQIAAVSKEENRRAHAA